MAKRVGTRVAVTNPQLPKPLPETNGPRETGIPADLPEKWLTQIKDALKQDNRRIFWTTVAGSSVIAALLGVIANFALESYKARLNHGLETHKVELQQQNKVRNETYEAYSALLLQLEQFS